MKKKKHQNQFLLKTIFTSPPIFQKSHSSKGYGNDARFVTTMNVERKTMNSVLSFLSIVPNWLRNLDPKTFFTFWCQSSWHPLKTARSLYRSVDVSPFAR